MDIRAEAAKYYDLWPPAFKDVAFYADRIPSGNASVLELGCGTGRVLIPLAESCAYVHGIDVSEAMVDICREKIAQAGLPWGRTSVAVGDITRFDLGRQFDLIIAPYRVFQNLETDEEIDGVFECVRKHLASDGSSILNVFRPGSVDSMKQKWGWGTEGEHFRWEVPLPSGRLTCHERRKNIDVGKFVLYPEAVYRKYEGDALVEEAILRICMRCYNPEQFEKLIVDHGYEIIGEWGGYDGEVYGEGNELVIQFRDST